MRKLTDSFGFSHWVSFKFERFAVFGRLDGYWLSDLFGGGFLGLTAEQDQGAAV